MAARLTNNVLVELRIKCCNVFEPCCPPAELGREMEGQKPTFLVDRKGPRPTANEIQLRGVLVHGLLQRGVMVKEVLR